MTVQKRWYGWMSYPHQMGQFAFGERFRIQLEPA
jgi:hypothetical protein